MCPGAGPPVPGRFAAAARHALRRVEKAEAGAVIGKERNDHLHGTLDALVLKALSWGPRHGYGVARWLEQTSDDTLRIEEGSLYPALYRLERRCWIGAEWG